MKKFLLILVGFLLVFSVGGVAGADLLDITVFDKTSAYDSMDSTEDNLVGYRGNQVNLLEGAWDYVRWTHYFDFDPEPEEITSASLTLLLRDDVEKDRCEVALSYTETCNWMVGAVDTGVEASEYQYDVSADFFLKNRELTVTLVSLRGDFYIDQSMLEIIYDPSSIGPRDVFPVPEPATMMLFGVGLVGMAAIGRKKLFRHI